MDPLDLSAIEEDATLGAEGITPYWAEIVLRLVAEAKQVQMAQESLQEAWAENERLRGTRSPHRRDEMMADEPLEWRIWRVGDRVRILGGQECPGLERLAGAGRRLTGTVTFVGSVGAHQYGHRFFVNFDQPYPTVESGGVVAPAGSSMFAANELEPAPGDDNAAAP